MRIQLSKNRGKIIRQVFGRRDVPELVVMASDSSDSSDMHEAIWKMDDKQGAICNIKRRLAGHPRWIRRSPVRYNLDSNLVRKMGNVSSLARA